MKCLRRLEDTNLYFLCDTSYSPDKEEKISVEGFSKAQRSLKELLIHEENYMQLWSISYVREGKIRDIYELILYKTIPKMIESTKEKRNSGQDGGRSQGADC